MTILIVEDNEGMRRLLRAIVCLPLWTCHECSDSSQVMAACARHLPDWVLMENELKTINGIALTKQIHASFPESRIVIVTSYDDADLRQAAFHAGATGFVLKENLIEVRRLLQSSLRQ